MRELNHSVEFDNLSCFVFFRQNFLNCIYILSEKESWALPCSHFFNSQE